MGSISALNNGVTGIQRGMAIAERSAAKIASAENMSSSNPVNVAEPLVDLMIARLQVEASAKVVESVSETIGSVIDIKA